MTKDDFITALSERMQTTKVQAEEAFTHCMGALQTLLMKGDKLTIPGFGVFMTRKREARTGRNPKTGQPLPVDAKFVPVFKPGDALKMKVNNALRSR
jgi:DNA-binding protein HU-beta